MDEFRSHKSNDLVNYLIVGIGLKFLATQVNVSISPSAENFKYERVREIATDI